LVRMKSASVPKTWLWIKAKAVWGGFDTKSPIALLSAQQRNNGGAN
jgi:hypothetical protein